ncbi:hypothetical protein AG1IA_08660 [Rhizoctonia solani AG-1 IA]|uniref:Uncharacterized protein n=1 Tax=Thanatephorus cucumeris (strain AG1-IA) TaxID=983506 RepID=L8WHC1_THACA|nr:hypothetical protein AG1IA_08660 [Rhizoctonia solani AG-1 IA]
MTRCTILTVARSQILTLRSVKEEGISVEAFDAERPPIGDIQYYDVWKGFGGGTS